jgi:signal transduction histidine kinase
MELSSETGRMRVNVADGQHAAAGILLGSYVRVRGLCQEGMLNSGGNPVAGSLFVSSMNDVQISQAAEVLWLIHPVLSITNAIQLPVGSTGELNVHLQGTVAEVKQGSHLVLKDATGKIVVHSSLIAASDQGKTVEVLGRLVQEGAQRQLRCAAVRMVFSVQSGTNSLPTLTTIEQIRRLKPDEAARSYPVQVRGVVTFAFSGNLRAHVQGETEGVFVAAISTNRETLQVGDVCEFQGTTGRGTFSPTVVYRKRTILGRGQIPEPLHPTRDQLMNGSLDAQWVEVQGIVLGVNGSDLLLGIQGGYVTARLFGGGNSILPSYVDSIVRVRGTVRPMANAQRQVQTVIIQVSSPYLITVDEPAPVDPFAVPSKKVSELLVFDPNAAFLQRIKTSGQVIHMREGMGYLMDGTNGMRFVLRNKSNLTVGDRVEVVGFPEIDRPSPLLQQALARKTGQEPLPEPRALPLDAPLDSLYDSTRVRAEAMLLSVSTNQSEQILELQIGSRMCVARLSNTNGFLPSVSGGSRVQLTGTYAGQVARGTTNSSLQSFELLLNSPNDLTVIQRPSWWTLQHALMAVGGMGLILVVAMVWITALRRRVEQRTRELKEEIESHKRTESELEEKTGKLENEIEERKRIEVEVERVHRQLVDASRQAGQAEVASSVLHNVGNVLNSVNVSSTLLAERLQNLRVGNLAKAANLLKANAADLGRFLTTDEKGKHLPSYLEKLALHLADEQTELLGVTRELTHNVDRIKEIVAMQQNYAKVSGVQETVSVAELVESALKMHAGAYERHAIGIERKFEVSPRITVDKHRVLQILVNILHNAKYACDEGRSTDRKVSVRIWNGESNWVKIAVADNGIGIASENLTRIFSYGFTTRKNGHGFGLHSAALAAKELGGSLTAQSDGLGKGATFILELPLGKPAPAASLKK